MEIPAILKSDFCASAALLGGTCFAAMDGLGLGKNAKLFCAITVTFILRIAAMKYKFSLPKVRSLPASPSELTQMRKTRIDKE